MLITEKKSTWLHPGRNEEKRISMELYLLLTACWYRGWPLRGLCPLSKSSESRAELLAVRGWRESAWCKYRSAEIGSVISAV